MSAAQPSLAAEIRAAKARSRLSLKDFAARVGVSPNAARAWMKGERVPSAEAEVILVGMGVKASFNRSRVKTDRRFRAKPAQTAFGNLLRVTRIVRDLPAKVVAKKVGIDYSAYSAWERGQATPGALLFVLVCEVLDIDLNEAARALKKGTS